MDLKDGIVSRLFEICLKFVMLIVSSKISHYNTTDRGGMIAPSVSAIWDKVQVELQCCGVNSYEDWYEIDDW